MRKVLIALAAVFALGAVAFAGGHIRSQKMNCRMCKCTYFSHAKDVASHCYCSCGHSYQSHDYK